ncbi:MFS transporter [Chryseobacterium soli]|uniref:MFS transporter n=1 Tax=Chryseobacterium soli TaxID=445961 RepID=UPI00295446B4|nr:MFS transporter [Chryseobacterium soli]MDV7697932.1 MFS transporter [Chryseobacterium soli]
MKINTILFVLALGIFGITTTEFGVIGILPEIASVFAISIDKAGWLLSSFAIIVAVFGPFSVMALSSFNRKKVLAFSLLVFAICNVLSALATTFSFLLIVRMIPAFFHPVYWSIALTVAVENTEPNQSSKAVSTLFSGLTLATVFGVPLATLLVDVLNWQFSFLVLAIINIVSFIGLLIYLPSINIPHIKAKHSPISILRKPVLWIHIILVFFMITAMYSTYAYMADFLKSVTNMNGKEISCMLFLFGITGVIGNRLAGKYMSRHPYQTTLVFIITLIGVHLLLFAFGSYFVPMIVIVGIWGLVHTGGFLISNVNIASSVTGAQEFVNSIFTSCGNAAVTAGSIAGGYWIVHFGIQKVIWLSILFLLLSLFVVFIKKVFYSQQQ